MASFETLPAEASAPPALNGPFYMDAELAPNRSLPNPGFNVLMGVLVGASFFTGIAFVSMGAWPVIGFFGLDVFLVWAAFRLSYRSGRLREYVRVAADGVDVTRVAPSGAVRRWRVPPQLARVVVDRPMKHEGQVKLVISGKALILGTFLSPPERLEFGNALQTAFDSARAERA